MNEYRMYISFGCKVAGIDTVLPSEALGATLAAKPILLGTFWVAAR